MGSASFYLMLISSLVIIAISVVIMFAKGISNWNKNNHSPKLSVPAEIVSKKIQTSTQSSPHSGNVNSAQHAYSTAYSRSYHVTFQVESGDKIEFYLSYPEYHKLNKGDKGTLSFQGTRYLGFEKS